MALSANKALGQHFLTNEGVIAHITDVVERLARGKKCKILEIGPGPGAITTAILKRGLPLHAIEFDLRMVEHLQAAFSSQIRDGQFAVTHADAMKVDFSSFADDAWVVCGNLPYNVGTHIVFRFLEEFPWAEHFCFMLQKEVVQRFEAEVGSSDYGIPSVKLAWCAEKLGHFWVKPGSFQPPPKVDSGVFWFRRIPNQSIPANPLVRNREYDLASRFVEKAFNQRRKMLRSSCREIQSIPEATPFLEKRPEQVSPLDLLKLGLLWSQKKS